MLQFPGYNKDTPGGTGADLEALKASALPIVLYGDGWYAPYVRRFLAREGLKPAACFTDAGFTSSGEALSFAEVSARFEKFNVVIAFANAALAREKLSRLGGGQAGVYFFDVMGPLLGNTMDAAYVERHRAGFAAAHALLSDEVSRRTFEAFISAKLTGEAGPLAAVACKEQYFVRGIMDLREDEVFVDGGAYTGDTLLTFARITGGRYARCRAFEPEPANAGKLREAVARRRLENVEISVKGLWSRPATLPFAVIEGSSASAFSGCGRELAEVDTVDNAAPDATFIKLDVEGAELEALKGASATIKRNRPKLAVCVYHRPSDLFEIPLFIDSLGAGYRFWLRQHQPVACETVLYAVPGPGRG